MNSFLKFRCTAKRRYPSATYTVSKDWIFRKENRSGNLCAKLAYSCLLGVRTPIGGPLAVSSSAWDDVDKTPQSENFGNFSRFHGIMDCKAGCFWSAECHCKAFSARAGLVYTDISEAPGCAFLVLAAVDGKEYGLWAGTNLT